MKKILYLLIFVVASLTLFPCDCGSFPPLTKELIHANPKNIIFHGKVIRVEACQQLGTAIFEIEELFQGKFKKQITAVYDCSSSCQMNFNTGEEWIIYGEFIQVEKIKIEFCSRSRIIQKSNNEETDKIAFGYTAAEELQWLRDSVGLKPLDQDDFNRMMGHRNEKPSPTAKIFLLIISMAVVIAIILISKKFLR